MTRSPAPARRHRPRQPQRKPRLSKDWAPFEAHLAECLGALEEGQYLILSHPKTHYFVQFAGQGRYGLRAEAKSNQYIGAHRQLGPDQERRLIELGWKAPTHAPEAEDSDPDGSPNWFQEYATPVNLPEVASMTCITLREVYGIRHPAELVYKAFERPARDIVFPTLGLDREARKDDGEPHAMEWISELKRAVESALLPHLTRFGIRRIEGEDLLTESANAFVIVREKENPFQILLFARLLADVKPGPKVWEALNQRNATLLVGRLFATDNSIWLDQVIPAEPFVPEQFVRVLAQMHTLTALLSTELLALLGGTRTQPDREPEETGG